MHIMLDKDDKKFIKNQYKEYMENSFPKYQYSQFVKRPGVDGQIVVRTDDEEEFKELIKFVTIACKPSKITPKNDVVASHQQSIASELPATKKCAECGGQMTLKSGTGKTGKPYTAYFCDERCGAKPEFIN